MLFPVEDYCREKLYFFIKNHPHYKSINEKLIEESYNFEFRRDLINMDGSATNVKAVQTGGKISSPTLSLIEKWILEVFEKQFGFYYKVGLRWMSNYGEGDYTTSHTHIPSAFAFNYFVKTPKGSSPLIFTTSGKKIKAEEGKVIIFPGNLAHHVPKNRCDGRIVLSGNIYPIFEE
tara:strand:+ start:237 stop:764 length:528 start_codon:yes stop_codon:yes gene_type:complete